MDDVVEDRRLMDALLDVYDPELQISVVDMGLIVSLHRMSRCVQVQLTFTAMGCPAMDMIIDDVRARLLREPGVEVVQIEVVWEPIWTKARLSEAGKVELLACGVSA